MHYLIGLIFGFLWGWAGGAGRQRPASPARRPRPLLASKSAKGPAPRRATPATVALYVRHGGRGLQVEDASGAPTVPHLMAGDTVVWHIEGGEQALFQFHDAALFDELKAPKTWTQACPVGDTLRLTVSSGAPVGMWPYALFCTHPDHSCTPVEPPPKLIVQAA